MAWYLLTSKPHSEGKALEKLLAQGFTCFLPLVTVEKVRRGVRIKVEEPLFPRYLFIELTEGRDAFGKVKNTRGVAGFVSFGTLATEVNEEVIILLRARCDGGTIVPGARLPRKHDQVEITDGPFKNLKAVFQYADGEKRAMVLLNILQQQIHLSVDNNDIRKIG